MTDSTLTLENLACERDDRLLFQGLQYVCGSGALVQIVGHNGAGKTTLLRTIAGLLPVETGSVLWCGKDIAAQRSFFNQQLLFLGHQTPIKSELTTRENLSWLCQLHLAMPARALDHALAEVGLYGYEETLCGALSAGQRRRVLLAQLYLSPAPLWILDEPFTAIDRAGVEALEALLQQHSARGGIALLTSHQRLSLNGLVTLNLADYQPSLQQEAGIEAGTNA